MIKQALSLVAMLAMVGCASQGSQSPQANTGQGQWNNPQPALAGDTPPQTPNEAELAAYAGAHQYPSTMPARSDTRAAAIVDGSQKLIKIYNFGTEPIRDADVWVNQAFVRHVNAIAPGSYVTVQMSNLYNGIGQQFSARGEHVNLVQIARDHEVQTLLGPAPQ